MDFEQDIRNCVHVLERGGLILYPTDTIWGIGCDAMNAAAIDAVFSLKHRPREKNLIVLLAEARDVLQYVASPPPDIIDILDSFESPTTIIYRHPLGFPENAVKEDDTLAIRVTRDPFCKALIKRLRRPLISTSANRSGMPAPAVFREVAASIKDQVDYVVLHRREDNRTAAPSRVLRLEDDGTLQVIRP